VPTRDLFEHAIASRFVPNCGFLFDVRNDKGKKCHPEEFTTRDLQSRKQAGGAQKPEKIPRKDDRKTLTGPCIRLSEFGFPVLQGLCCDFRGAHGHRRGKSLPGDRFSTADGSFLELENGEADARVPVDARRFQCGVVDPGSRRLMGAGHVRGESPGEDPGTIFPSTL